MPGQSADTFYNRHSFSSKHAFVSGSLAMNIQCPSEHYKNIQKHACIRIYTHERCNVI